MKIVVIGGTGLIGSKLVEQLRKDGHEPLAASPDTGVDALTGEGLAAALAGARAVVDVANAPAWSDAEALGFFQSSSRNLLAAEAAAGVGHHFTLSVPGTDRLPESGYFRAKAAQDELVKAGPTPYTIVRATQFFEFIGRIADRRKRTWADLDSRGSALVNLVVRRTPTNIRSRTGERLVRNGPAAGVASRQHEPEQLGVPPKPTARLYAQESDGEHHLP